MNKICVILATAFFAVAHTFAPLVSPAHAAAPAATNSVVIGNRAASGN